MQPHNVRDDDASAVARSDAPPRRCTDYRIYLAREDDPQGVNTVEGLVQVLIPRGLRAAWRGFWPTPHVAHLSCVNLT